MAPHSKTKIREKATAEFMKTTMYRLLCQLYRICPDAPTARRCLMSRCSFLRLPLNLCNNGRW
jgi:hypothetical protein